MRSERIEISAASSLRMKSVAWSSASGSKNLMATVDGGTSGASSSGSTHSAAQTMPKLPTPMR